MTSSTTNIIFLVLEGLDDIPAPSFQEVKGISHNKSSHQEELIFAMRAQTELFSSRTAILSYPPVQFPDIIDRPWTFLNSVPRGNV